MKTITSLLVACALALAGAVSAQQPETQESPAKKEKKGAPTEQATPPRGHETKGKPPTAAETRGRGNQSSANRCVTARSRKARACCRREDGETRRAYQRLAGNRGNRAANWWKTS